MTTPTVDVIIPVYNGARFIVACIQSVLDQRYPVAQVIVVDDGSTDDTVAQIQPLADTRVTLLRQPHTGVSAARNMGIKASQAELVAFVDADDIWHPDKLARQVALFQEKREAEKTLPIIYCGYRHILEDGSDSSEPCFEPHLEGHVFEDLLADNLISGSNSTVLVARECLEKTGLYNETLTACEDWDLFLRLSQYYPFYYVPEPLVSIRLHGKQSRLNYIPLIAGRLVVQQQWKAQMAQRPELIRKTRDYVWHYLFKGIEAYIQPVTQIFKSMDPDFYRLMFFNSRYDTVWFLFKNKSFKRFLGSLLMVKGRN